MVALPAQDRRADADLQRVLEQLAAFHAPPVATVTPRLAHELPSFATPRRVAVAGESAGRNLATGVALQARNRNLKLPVHQLLVYPVTNFVKGPPPPSYRENPTTIPLATPAMAWFGPI